MIDYILLGIIIIIAVIFALISSGIIKRAEKKAQEILLEGILDAIKQDKKPQDKIKICKETKRELEAIGSNYPRYLSAEQFEDLFYSGFARAHVHRLRDVNEKYGSKTALNLYIGNFVFDKAKNKSKEFHKEVKFYKKHKWF